MSDTKLFSETLHEWTETFMHHSFYDFKHFMDASGLSASQVNALMQCYHGTSCGVSDMGQAIGLSNAAASQVVDHLVQLDLMERTENPDDRRFKQLTLTPQGRALVQKGVEARCHWLEGLAQILTETQQVEIVSALAQLIDAVCKLETN